jgi:hypothetical protein
MVAKATSERRCTIEDAFGNDERFEQIGQTAQKRFRKMFGAWVEPDPIAPVM